MYKIGQYVIYSSLGIYRIDDICRQNVLGRECDYYALSELDDVYSSRTYVPVGSDAERNSMRELISVEEANALLLNFDKIEPLEWLENSKSRFTMHKKIIESANRTELIAMIKSIDEKQRCRITERKKPYLTEGHTRERAVKLITTELSTVLGVSVSEIKERLFSEN